MTGTGLDTSNTRPSHRHDAENITAADDHDGTPQTTGPAPPYRPASTTRLAVSVGIVIVSTLAALTGWLGVGSWRSQHDQQQRLVYLQTARQGALNLTTISDTEADADIARILASATGEFHDEFQQHSQPFIETIKQAHSKSQGTITEAGLESADADSAQAIVAVSVKTSTAGADAQQPRLWRMRISVQRDGDGAKVSKVEFVP